MDAYCWGTKKKLNGATSRGGVTSTNAEKHGGTIGINKTEKELQKTETGGGGNSKRVKKKKNRKVGWGG